MVLVFSRIWWDRMTVIGRLLIAVMLSSCISGDDLQNPFDPRSDPSAWRPTEFEAEVQGPNSLILSWKQSVTPVDGFLITKVVDAIQLVITVPSDKRSFNDNAILPPDFSGCSSVTYTIRAFAGNNKSDQTGLSQGFQVPLTSTAAAGNDVDIPGLQVNLVASEPRAGEEGEWIVVTGTGGEFANPSAASTSFSGNAFVPYVLRWTITGPCAVSSDELNVIFRQLPTVSTGQPLQVGYFTADVPGEVLSDGGSPVTARGICYGIAPSPTTSGSKVTVGAGTGAFVANLTGLAGGTVYYARTFATNTGGTQYGNEITIQTLEPEWTAIGSGTTKDLFAVTWVNSSLGFVAGDGALHLQSTHRNAFLRLLKVQSPCYCLTL